MKRPIIESREAIVCAMRDKLIRMLLYFGTAEVERTKEQSKRHDQATRHSNGDLSGADLSQDRRRSGGCADGGVVILIDGSDTDVATKQQPHSRLLRLLSADATTDADSAAPNGYRLRLRSCRARDRIPSRVFSLLQREFDGLNDAEDAASGSLFSLTPESPSSAASATSAASSCSDRSDLDSAPFKRHLTDFS